MVLFNDCSMYMYFFPKILPFSRSGAKVLMAKKAINNFKMYAPYELIIKKNILFNGMFGSIRDPLLFLWSLKLRYL